MIYFLKIQKCLCIYTLTKNSIVKLKRKIGKEKHFVLLHVFFFSCILWPVFPHRMLIKFTWQKFRHLHNISTHNFQRQVWKRVFMLSQFNLTFFWSPIWFHTQIFNLCPLFVPFGLHNISLQFSAEMSLLISDNFI